MARALIGAAAEHVLAWGRSGSPARAIEGYPRGDTPGRGRLHDEEAWVGTQELFESCGFVRIAGEPAYPVMRKVLATP